jgi:hypothetical protein
MLICAICGARFPFNSHCEQTHPDLCHPCGDLSWKHSLGYYEHPDPEGVPVLSARETEAVALYTQHVARVVGIEGRDVLLQAEGC